MKNVIIKNLKLKSTYAVLCGIYLGNCSDITIYHNKISGYTAGIGWYICGGKQFVARGTGIFVDHGSGYNITKNEITGNSIGVYFTHITDYIIYQNNLDNEDNAGAYKSVDEWDNGSVGNYWSDYNGTDTDGDGIGDTPYIINEDNQDRYPLMNPLVMLDQTQVFPTPVLVVTLAITVMGGAVIWISHRKSNQNEET